MKYLLIFILIFTPFILTAQIPDTTREYKFSKIAFKSIDNIELCLHVFQPLNLQASDKRPAIVFFFGGGWENGSPEQFYEFCKYFAALELVCIAAEYRVKSVHGTTPFESVMDAKSAIRWVRANAEPLHIDPNRIAAAGGSAGGHLAACTALINGLDSPTDNLLVSCIPNVLILFNPVVDTSEKGYGSQVLGSRYKELSPIEYIHADMPSTIIFHGTDDSTVPYENAERFCDLMEKKGNLCTLVKFEGKNHGFFNYGVDNNVNFEQCVRFMEKFLAILGFLPLVN